LACFFKIGEFFVGQTGEIVLDHVKDVAACVGGFDQLILDAFPDIWHEIPK
jgi:hypothetical protein